MEKKKIVFLYTEIAPYFIACVRELAANPGTEIHIVRWPVNHEAPFQFVFPDSIRIYDRSDFPTRQHLLDHVRIIAPSLIFVSGWLDKDYTAVCRHYRKNIPVLLGLDNHWFGTFRQRIAVLLSPFRIHNTYSHAWVPGRLQVEYARRLGFKNANILTGFYSCDVPLFHSFFERSKEQKRKVFPKRFIYVGRYVAQKGIHDLWTAFAQLQAESPGPWELWCLGTGDIEGVRHEKIRHLGFVQPGEMEKHIRETGVFILPSHFEPWGVVVHEFAAAGFPLICSDEIGARFAFVENDHNGYIYKSGNVAELKSAMKRIMDMPDELLFQMAQRSVEKSMQVTPAKWAETLLKLIH